MLLCACMNYMCLLTSIMCLVLVDFHTSSLTIFIVTYSLLQYELPLPTPAGQRIGRRQTGGAAASPCPSSKRLYVDNEDDFTPPNSFNMRSTEPSHLPERNSSPIDNFFLLFTVAMMWVVLRNTQDICIIFIVGGKKFKKKIVNIFG